MAHQLTDCTRTALIENLGKCKRYIGYADERGSDLLEALVRCIESDDETKLDNFLRSVYPAVREALKP
jgi:hypothetical protein